MDLTIPVENYILNIRVLVLIKSGDNYIFEKHNQGYYFGVGGRVKIGERSDVATIREVEEELGVTVIDLKYKTVIENFYDNVHEICFVYTCENIYDLEIDTNLFKILNINEINSEDIRPEILKKIVLEGEECKRNYVVSKI